MGPVTVLSLSQSGYAPADATGFDSKFEIQDYVVMSVAAGDKSGLPDQETLDALSGYSVSGQIETARLRFPQTESKYGRPRKNERLCRISEPLGEKKEFQIGDTFVNPHKTLITTYRNYQGKANPS